MAWPGLCGRHDVFVLLPMRGFWGGAQDAGDPGCEAVLRQPVGGAVVMREQLRHLVEAARVPRVPTGASRPTAVPTAEHALTSPATCRASWLCGTPLTRMARS